MCIRDNFNTDFEIKIDSTATIYINPTFSKNKSSSAFSRNQVTTNETFNELNLSLIHI